MLELYQNLVKDFKIFSIEDPFDQNDLKSWQNITKALKNTLIIGDDVLCTNTNRIKLARDHEWCSGLLLKPNQIGTLTESLQSAKLSAQAGWQVMVSHRSGDTEDSFIADLAVGIGSGLVKAGAPCRGERTAKYN